jgi:hypothetical protein
MRVCLPVVWLLVSAATVAHAQTATAKLVAALSGKSDLESFVSAYLLGFIVSLIWLAFRAWRAVRADVRALRGGR